MYEKIKAAAAVSWIFAAGVLFGAYAAVNNVRLSAAEAQVAELSKSYQGVLNELNQKVLPEIQKRLDSVATKK